MRVASPIHWILLVAVLSLPSIRAGQNVSFAWDPTPGSETSYYNVYYGEVGGITKQFAVGNVLEATLSDLTEGKTYFVYVTAVTSAGHESPPSNQIWHSPSEGRSHESPPSNQIWHSPSEGRRQDPVLADLPDLEVSPGQLLMGTIRASDPDSPAEALTYRLESGPEGAVLDPTSGLLTWRLSKSEAEASVRFVVSVSDDSSPPLSDIGTFLVTVAAPRKSRAKKTTLGALTWTTQTASGTVIRFMHPLREYERVGSSIHRLEVSEDLVNWFYCGRLTEADELSDRQGPAEGGRFYRVRSEVAAPFRTSDPGEAFGARD